MKSFFAGIGLGLLIILAGAVLVEPWLGDSWKDNLYCFAIGWLSVMVAERWFGD